MFRWSIIKAYKKYNMGCVLSSFCPFLRTKNIEWDATSDCPAIILCKDESPTLTCRTFSSCDYIHDIHGI